MNIIETHNLTRRFGRTEAVNDLNLSIPTGSICALLGPNGAGKTTLLKLLLNLLKPTAGYASVLGVDSRRLSAKEFADIGYVSENQQLPLWMTVRQFLNYCRPLYPTWDAQLEKELMAQFELPEDRKLGKLSRGMLMKAALLSALAFRPKLLVLDEPFSGLDPLVRDEFVHGVLEVSQSREWSVLIATHDVGEVEQLTDMVVMLSGGEIRLTENVGSLLSRFRRVVIEGAVQTAAAPDEVMEWEQAGNLIRFVTNNYREAKSKEEWMKHLKGERITCAPMSLRDIFVVLARAERKGMKS